MLALDTLETIQYILNMRRGERYVGVINGKRHWRAKNCGHPVTGYNNLWCQPCWFKSEQRQFALKKKKVFKNVATGEKHHSWKGGKHINTGGYMMIRVNGKYKPEHRHIMEQHIGRELSGSEEVHHINHDKLDNRIENLMLFKNHSDHIKYEHKEGNRRK